MPRQHGEAGHHQDPLIGLRLALEQHREGQAKIQHQVQVEVGGPPAVEHEADGGGFLGDVGVPHQQELADPDVGPEAAKGEEQLAQVVVLGLGDLRQQPHPAQDNGADGDNGDALEEHPREAVDGKNGAVPGGFQGHDPVEVRQGEGEPEDQDEHGGALPPLYNPAPQEDPEAEEEQDPTEEEGAVQPGQAPTKQVICMGLRPGPGIEVVGAEPEGQHHQTREGQQRRHGPVGLENGVTPARPGGGLDGQEEQPPESHAGQVEGGHQHAGPGVKRTGEGADAQRQQTQARQRPGTQAELLPDLRQGGELGPGEVAGRDGKHLVGLHDGAPGVGAGAAAGAGFGAAAFCSSRM